MRCPQQLRLVCRFGWTVFSLFLLFSLTAQEKGLSPISSTEDVAGGQTWAVVVGISDYQDPGIPDLRFAHRDAEAFASFLRSTAGGSLDADHLKVLLNEEATMGQFANALDWLWQVCQEGDEAIIYFSGHGDVEKKSLTQPGFLLCWDAPSRVYMAGGAFALQMLQEVISTLSMQNKARVVAIMDACHSGALAGNAVGGAQATTANLARLYANEIKILSCQPNEYSIEGEQWGGGRGAFSFNLVDALYGLADANQDLSVTLLEVGRYLEDHVTAQVAPVSQVPMVLGKKTEPLASVDDQFVAELRSGRASQLQMLSPVESRGMEEDVLSKLDSAVRELYRKFNRTLEDKIFLEPANACAEAYYSQLIREAGLAPLHAAMTRNYAAALQDDAQQVLNVMLKTGLTDQILKASRATIQYRNYPAYLDRAAQLLGRDHYLYSTLMARKYFFSGMIEPDRKDRRAAFHQALAMQPDMPHAMVRMAASFDRNQLDSAEYYIHKAMDMLPSWVEPYVVLADLYSYQWKQYDRAEELLDQAGLIDTSSLLVQYKKASLLARMRRFKEAEQWYLKTIQSSGEDICFPCAHNDLGEMYLKQRGYQKAEEQFHLALQLDSTYALAYINLGMLEKEQRRFAEAEEHTIRGMALDPELAGGPNNLGAIYLETGRFAEAEAQLLKALQMDSTQVGCYVNMGFLCWKTNRLSEAEHYFEMTIERDSTILIAYGNLAVIYKQTGRLEEAEWNYLNVVKLDSTIWQIYANLNMLYQETGRWEEAAEMAERALHFGPPFADLDQLLVMALLNIPERSAEIEPALIKALGLDPQHAGIHMLYARWCGRSGRIEEAWTHLEQSLSAGIPKKVIDLEAVRTEPDFEVLRSDPKWVELMRQYVPDQNRD